MENEEAPAVDLLSALLEVEQCARNVFSAALSKGDPPRLRTLKFTLAGLHSEHLRKLRERMYAMGGPARSHGSPTSVISEWPQLRTALVSSRIDSVTSACAQAEEKVVQAYEHALEDPRVDDTLHPFLASQLDAVRRARDGIGQFGVG